MRRTSRQLAFFFSLSLPFLVSGSLFAAEEKLEFPQVSQHAVVKQRIGLTDVEIEYSRPNKNDRDIFGGLVPFDKVWRTGANEPTKIKFSDAVKIGDKEIPAGEYALYTLPAKGDWTIILSKDLKTGYKPEADVMRTTVTPVSLSTPVETFTIGFEGLKIDSATFYLEWDKTRVPLKLTTNTVDRVNAQIDAAVKSGREMDAAFYNSAAGFYFDQNKDLAQAVKWIDQATEKNPTAYFMFTKKAQILAKLGDKSKAIAAAEKSNEILEARPERDEAAIRNNRLLIESLR